LDFFHARWPVFHEDNHLLVLYKPAGLVMQRGTGAGPNMADMAKAWLKERHNRPGRVFAGIVHRLDGPVAGVLVLARTSKAASRLSLQFRTGAVEKTYLAVVQGRPEPFSGRLVHRLVRRGRYSIPALPHAGGGQDASLSYRVLETRPGGSLVEVKLETGRRHQIRAQLAAVGCPVTGDVGYGAPRGLPHGCIALLARRLAFVHPTLGSPLSFTCPAPEGWPWAGASKEQDRPYWALEDYGLRLTGPLRPQPPA
jgi:23S rRNA pseudouridine1911/1915/1917 synthase